MRVSVVISSLIYLSWSFPWQASDEAANRGVEYMLRAAVLGDRQAMVYMAKAYESGSGLGSQRYGTASTFRVLSCMLHVLSLVKNRKKKPHFHVFGLAIPPIGFRGLRLFKCKYILSWELLSDILRLCCDKQSERESYSHRKRTKATMIEGINPVTNKNKNWAQNISSHGQPFRSC